MKFITLLFIISSTLFAKGQTYVLLGVSADDMKIKRTLNLSQSDDLKRSYSANIGIGEQFKNYKYSLNILAKDNIFAFVSLDYLYPSMIEGNTDAFIGLSLGKSKLKILNESNNQEVKLNNVFAGLQAGFTSNKFELGYRYFFLNEEYTYNSYKKEIKYLHSLYIVYKF